MSARLTAPLADALVATRAMATLRTPAGIREDGVRFIVSRTSGLKPPCEGAERATYTAIDTRTWPTLQKASKEFLGSGINHREVPGVGVARDLPGSEAWFIEIADLDALLAFIADHDGQAVISRDTPEEPPRIEIYDDYRE